MPGRPCVRGAAMKTNPEWTADEIIAELKRRERHGTAARAVDKQRDIGMTTRFSDMSQLSTAELARMAQDRQRVVYGVDNRQDLYKVTNIKVRKAAQAVVALVEKRDLVADGHGSWRLKTTKYQEDYKLCSSEAFSSQPLGCFCSGFLVRPDVVATAGHCVKSDADLAHGRFVFGF